MDQSEFELQLQVWKDLAISKQVLMGAATDAEGDFFIDNAIHIILNLFKQWEFGDLTT